MLLLVRIARRMFRSNVFGVLAGLLLALDGISLVLSRVALLDIFLQLFVLAGFAALVLDRDQMRARLGGLVARASICRTASRRSARDPGGLAGGVLLGLACAVKWSALSFFVLFAVLSLMWDRGALKTAGVRRSWRWAARRGSLPAVGSLLVAPTAAYLFTWLGWFVGENSWNRHWGDSHPSATRLDILGIRIPFSWGFLPRASARSGLPPQRLPVPRGPRLRRTRTVQSVELADPRPTGQFLLSGDGVHGCGATSCTREVLLIGTPMMWWAFVPALVWLVWHWLTTRDWRAGAVLVAFVAGWVVWLQDPSGRCSCSI